MMDERETLARSWIEKVEAVRASLTSISVVGVNAKAPLRGMDSLIRSLDGLPVDVGEYFLEATKCLQYELARPAIVMSWSGYFFVFCEQLFAGKEANILAKTSSWRHPITSLDALREEKDNTIINLAKDVSFITSSQRRIIDGHLAKRNECAHPTLYRPRLYEAVGYVEEMVVRTQSLLSR